MRYDAGAKVRDFELEETLFPRTYFSRYSWNGTLILRRTGLLFYDVRVGNSNEHLHASQLRRRSQNIDHQSKKEEIDLDIQIALKASELSEQTQAVQQKSLLVQASIVYQPIISCQMEDQLVPPVNVDNKVLQRVSSLR